jgi:hypothetical protein
MVNAVEAACVYPALQILKLTFCSRCFFCTGPPIELQGLKEDPFPWSDNPIGTEGMGGWVATRMPEGCGTSYLQKLKMFRH